MCTHKGETRSKESKNDSRGALYNDERIESVKKSYIKCFVEQVYKWIC